MRVPLLLELLLLHTFSTNFFSSHFDSVVAYIHSCVPWQDENDTKKIQVQGTCSLWSEFSSAASSHSMSAIHPDNFQGYHDEN